MTLLLHHFEQSSLVLVESMTNPSQPGTVELKFAAADQETEHIHPLFDLTDRHGKAQAHQIAGTGLGLDLPTQNRLEQGDRQQRIGQTGAQHLHIDGVRQIAKAPGQRLIHGLHPVQQGIRHNRKEIARTGTGAAWLAGDQRHLAAIIVLGLQGLASEFKQGLQNIQIIDALVA